MSTRPPRQCWATPPDAWQWIDKTFGPFELDVCATKHNSKCRLFIGPPDYDETSTLEEPYCIAEDALHADWPGAKNPVKAFCNPPFADPFPWVLRAHDQMKRHGTHTWMLLHSASTPEWFDWAVEHATRIVLPRPRLQFVPPEGVKPSTNSKDSMLLEFRPGAGAAGVAEYMQWKPVTTARRRKMGL